jgi:phosphoribosyl 1,2-cyclic phosphate phosphodiesterase
MITVQCGATFRVGGLGYVTDASAVPPDVRAALRGLDVLVLNALRYRAHPAHLSLAEAVAVVQELRPQRAYFTHIAHDLDHAAVNRELPPGMQLAYDGLELDICDQHYG